MGDTTIVEQITLNCPVGRAFEIVANEGLPGWRSSSRPLQRGTPVIIPMSLPPALGGNQIEVLGRVCEIVPGRRIVVEHELPWHGKISVRLATSPAGDSVVRVVVDLNTELIEWVSRGLAPAPRPDTAATTFRLGLISSASGPASIFSLAARRMATLAVEQINADGGVLGRQIDLIMGDDGTHPGLGAAELVRLIHAGCRVVLANVTSEVFSALRPVARRHGVLVVHTVLNEGGRVGNELVRFGERPYAQAAAALPLLVRDTGASQFFLVGNDYSWPEGASRSVRRVIDRLGGTVVGEARIPLGTVGFTPLIDTIRRSGADVVVSSFIGADEVAFEQQMYSAGTRQQIATLALVLDDSTCEYIGRPASEGLWTAFSYFEGIASADNDEFRAQYYSRFGADAPPISSLSQGVYEAVNLIVRAMSSSHSTDPEVIGDRLRSGVEYNGPRGTVSSSATGLRQVMRVAVATGAGMEIRHDTLPG